MNEIGLIELELLDQPDFLIICSNFFYICSNKYTNLSHCLKTTKNNLLFKLQIVDQVDNETIIV